MHANELAQEAKRVAQQVQRGGRLRPDTRALALIGKGQRAGPFSAQPLQMRNNEASNDARADPDYGIYTHSSGEPLHTLEMHVLARAYRTAWRSLFSDDPVGPHAIPPLDVMFVFSSDA